MGPMYGSVFEAFLASLASSSPQGEAVYRQLEGCSGYVTTIGSCQKSARDAQGKKDAKQAVMKSLMQDPKNQYLPNALKEVNTI